MQQQIVTTVLTGRIAAFGPKGEPSAYRKAPREGRVEITPLGLVGDEQADLAHHGGVEKAIHHYPFDHYPHWAAENPDLAVDWQLPEAFGENISTAGWLETDVCVGDRFRLGSAVVEISQGRDPCWKLGHRLGKPALVARVVATGRCGWYYRVIEPGALEAGDRVVLLERPHPAWDVRRVFRLLISRDFMPEEVAELGEVAQLSPSWRKRCTALLGR